MTVSELCCAILIPEVVTSPVPESNRGDVFYGRGRATRLSSGGVGGYGLTGTLYIHLLLSSTSESFF